MYDPGRAHCTRVKCRAVNYLHKTPMSVLVVSPCTSLGHFPRDLCRLAESRSGWYFSDLKAPRFLFFWVTFTTTTRQMCTYKAFTLLKVIGELSLEMGGWGHSQGMQKLDCDGLAKIWPKWIFLSWCILQCGSNEPLQSQSTTKIIHLVFGVDIW